MVTTPRKLFVEKNSDILHAVLPYRATERPGDTHKPVIIGQTRSRTTDIPDEAIGRRYHRTTGEVVPHGKKHVIAVHGQRLSTRRTGIDQALGSPGRIRSAENAPEEHTALFAGETVPVADQLYRRLVGISSVKKPPVVRRGASHRIPHARARRVRVPGYLHIHTESILLEAWKALQE